MAQSSFNKIWSEALGTFGAEVVERAQRNLGASRMVNGKKRRSVASGNLKNSLSFMRVPIQSPRSVVFFAKGTAGEYADVVEQGRRAHSKAPPVDKILEWMRVKPVRLRGPAGGFIAASEKQKIRVAFAIARRIGERGIPPVWYFRDALNETLIDRQDELQEKLGEAVLAEIDLKEIKAKKT